MSVRVRFAPSPTGYLHVGGARTALFNWLFARHHGGTFILRIEDTDLERSTEESVRAILESMEWLGLDWDEGPGKEGPHGPYFQTQRLELYQRYARELLQKGRAYHCYCTPEELEERRNAALARGEAPRYDGRCSRLTPQEAERLAAEGRRPVVRFRAAGQGRTVVQDLIRGKVTFENEVIDDFVILKADGVPTYNFAVVVDDALMEITHVIRGEDHLSNTPKQIQLYEALGFALPAFAHIPMILGPDRTRLSKRHGATSVTQYREAGYLPEAMVNYLALLGWSLNATDQIFSRQELIEHFSLERVSKNPAVFDPKKLQWMNGVYIRRTELDRLVDLALPHLARAGLVPAEPSPAQREYVRRVVASLQTRVRTLEELAELGRYFFQERVEYEEEALPYLAEEYVPRLLASLAERLARVEPFTAANVEAVFAAVQEETGLSAGQVIHPVRSAVTGRKVSPGIYEVLEILGRARTCQRLKEGAEAAKKLSAARR
ncbi:MAG: glutamate--tRNA ligase [Bacillota bacterium]|nr:glutamate--tRNA ligase [Bacillota bacterium]